MLSWLQFIPIISLLIAIVVVIAKVSHRVGNLERDLGNLRTEFTLHRKENRDDFQALRNGLDQLNQNFINQLASYNELD